MVGQLSWCGAGMEAVCAPVEMLPLSIVLRWLWPVVLRNKVGRICDLTFYRPARACLWLMSVVFIYRLSSAPWFTRVMLIGRRDCCVLKENTVF